MEYKQYYESPLGRMIITVDDDGLNGLWFEGQKYLDVVQIERCVNSPNYVTEEVVEWLDIYFKGCIPDFVPTIHMVGTEFRKCIWRLLLEIPYGEIVTYGELTQRYIKESKAAKMSAQAVGGAVGHNRISIVVPCHRVIGADGSLTGYAGGVERKEKLLEIERHWS